MRDGNLDGMQVFDDVIEQLIRNATITMNDGLVYATNRQNLMLNSQITAVAQVAVCSGRGRRRAT